LLVSTKMMKMSDFTLQQETVQVERGLQAEWKRVKDVTKAFVSKAPSLLKELYMVHKILTEAVPYKVDGIAEDNAWVYKNRSFIESYAIDEMRNQGYIPVLDAVSEFQVSFDAETEKFNYTVSIPGYKHERASEFAGILANQALLVGMNMEKVSVIEL
jgi:hypothetical protein